MEPRQAVMMPIMSVILSSSPRILSIEEHLLHGVIQYIRSWNARDHLADEVIHCMRSLGTGLSQSVMSVTSVIKRFLIRLSRLWGGGGGGLRVQISTLNLQHFLSVRVSQK